MQKSQEVGIVLREMQETWKLLRGTYISDKQTSRGKLQMSVSLKGGTFQITQVPDDRDWGSVEELHLIFQGFLSEDFLGSILCTVPLITITLTSTTNNAHKSTDCHVHKAINKPPLKEGNHTAWKVTNLEREGKRSYS